MTFPTPDLTSGWVVRHKDHAGTIIDQFKPENLRFTLNRKSPHTISYELSHEWLQYYYSLTNFDGSFMQDFVGAYRTDFDLLYNGYYVMGGMHVPAPVVNKGDGFTTINGKSYLHYLERRHYPYDPGTVAGPSSGTYAGVSWGERVNFKQAGSAYGYAYYVTLTDVTVIMKYLLDVTLNGVAGFPITDSLPLTYPTISGAAIGLPVSFALSLGDTTPILNFIDQLSNIGTGFDYEVIDEFMEFRIYAPRKYDPVTASASSAGANYVFDPTNADLITDGPSFTNNGPLATHWLASGSGKGNQQLGVALNMQTVAAVFRRLDGSSDYGDVRNWTDLQNLAKKDMAWSANPAHEIAMTVEAFEIDKLSGGNFFLLFQPGYPIWLDSELHSHRIQSGQEIISMDVAVESSGNFTCRLGLNQIYNPQTAGLHDGT